MGMNVVYAIESANDREGEMKELPESWTNELYTTDLVTTGRGAILGMVKNPDKFLKTSTVESFYLHESYLVITTKNTVYYLKVAGIQ